MQVRRLITEMRRKPKPSYHVRLKCDQLGRMRTSFIGGSRMLDCFGKTLEHNAVDTMGNHAMNDSQFIDITDLTLTVAIFIFIYYRLDIIESSASLN